MTYECRAPIKSSMPVIGQSPCEKIDCQHKKKCANELLACTSLQRWVNTGRALHPTLPDKETYNRIFSSDDLPVGGVSGIKYTKRKDIAA